MTRSPIFLASAPAPSTVAAGTIWRWNSATPYLLGGIVLVMMLIAVAMLMLVCSVRRENSRSAAAMAAGEKSVKGPDVTGSSVPVPEFVVIMAGDEKPTFLAMPTILPATNSPAGEDVTAADLTAR